MCFRSLGLLSGLPVADGVGVLNYDFVHPGEGMREQHGSLEEAHVAAVQRQGEYHVGHLFYQQKEESFKSAIFSKIKACLTPSSVQSCL